MPTDEGSPRQGHAEGSELKQTSEQLSDDCISLEELLVPYLVPGSVDANGERRGHCPLHHDVRPSCSYNFDKQVWHCHSGCDGGPLHRLRERLLARHEARFVPGWVVEGEGSGRSGRSKGSTWPLPDEAQIAGWHARLLSTPEALTYLIEGRGVALEDIERYQIGLRSDGSDELVFPVYDAHGDLVNVRRRKLERGRNMRNWCGHGSPARLYPVDQLEHDELIICEGELDALAAISVGISAITTTGGSGGLARWRDEWTPWFAGKRVTLVPDCDEQSKLGMQAVQSALRKVAAVSWVALPYNVTPEHGKDLTDYLVRDGHSALDLMELIDTARAQVDDDAPREYVLLSDVQARPVTWQWQGRIAVGHLSIIEGDPDRGKTYVATYIAACISTGRPMYGEGSSRAPEGVLLICPEDRLDDTLRPRLEVHGADLDRIGSIRLQRDDEGNLIPLQIPEELSRIRKAAKQLDAKLIVIDPITGVLSETINSNNDASTRRALTPLAELAEDLDAAILLIRHLNKNSQETKSAYRGGGSIAFTGAARSVLVMDRDPDTPSQFVMASVKNNLSVAVPSLRFNLTQDPEHDLPHVEWLGTTPVDADRLLRSHDARLDAPQRDQAVEFLMDYLADGPKPGSDAKKATKTACGVSEKTVRNAAGKMGLVRNRVYVNNKIDHWTWELPYEDGTAKLPS